MTTQDTRSPEEIEAEIERTQNDMSRTVDRLGDQFTPRNLMNALFDKAEENDVQARQLYDGARRNPLALGLIAGGLIWLVSDQDAKPSSFTSDDDFDDDYDDGYDGGYGRAYDDPHHRGYVDHMAAFERLDNEDDTSYRRRRDLHRGSYLMIEQRHDEDDAGFRKRLDDATDTMRQKRDDAAETMRRKRDEWADQMRSAGRDIGDRSRRGTRRVKRAYNDDPLIGGALAAFAGLAAGLAAPASSRERELIGRQASDVLDTAKHKAQDAAEKARTKKDEAVEKAEHRIEDADTDSRSSGAEGGTIADLGANPGTSTGTATTTGPRTGGTVTSY